ncbi:spore germination protein [Lachnospiraceae bacterium KM106-2]|nr:spore germination protein [Lachnospiraceae bacterium KM106-2]
MLFFISQINGTLYRYSEESVGKILSFVVGILYVFKLGFSCVVMVQLFSTVINKTLLAESMKYYIIIPMILVGGYETYKGAEVRARMTELLFYIVLVPIFIMLIFGLKEVDLANLTPVFASGAKQTIYGSYLVFMVFNIIEFTIFLKPYIREEKTKQEELKKLFWNAFHAIVIAIVFFLLFFLLTVGILGMTGANQSMWSTVNIFQIIEVPGSLINRQDSLILGLWLLSIFTLISGFIFYLSVILKEMFCVKHKNTILPVILVILILCSMIPIQQEQLFQIYLEYMKKIGIPQSLVIPLILIVVTKLRGKNRIKAPKSAVILIVCLLAPFLLSGCSKHVEIEDRDFVQVIGLDMENDKMKTYFVLPDLQAMTDQGPTDDTDKLIKQFEGDDYIQIEEQYKLQSEKLLDYSHLKAIILGKEFAKNKDRMKSFLDYVESNYQLSKKTLIFLADEKAEDIIKMNGDIPNGIGSYLERLYQNNLGNSEKKEIVLASLLQVKNNSDQSIFLPRLQINEKRILINGEAVFHHSTVETELNAEESIITDIISGYGENARLFVNIGENQTNECVAKIRQIQKKLSVDLVDGKPILTLKINAIGAVEKGLENYEGLSYSQKAKIYRDIETALNDSLKEKIYNQMTTVMREQGVDYLNVYRSMRYKNNSLYQKYKNNEKGFLSEMQFNIQVTIDLVE